MRGAFFGAVADSWFKRIGIDGVYRVRGGRIYEPERQFKKYNRTNSRYEIRFDRSTSFTPASDEEIGFLSYQYVQSLAAIQELSRNDFIDVLAVVHSVTFIRQQRTQNPRSVQCVVSLCDPSSVIVPLKLWDQAATDFLADARGSVIQVKDAEIDYFRSIELRIRDPLFSVELNPDIPEADDLHRWWNETGTTADFETLSFGPNSIKQTEDLAIINKNRSEVPKFFVFYGVLREVPFTPGRPRTSGTYYGSLAAALSCVNHRFIWMACPKPECNNQRLDEVGGGYVCRVCGEDITEPKPHFAFRCRMADHSGSAIICVFDDGAGTALLGVTPEEWMRQVESKDEMEILELANVNELREFKVAVKVEEDKSNGSGIPKLSAVFASPIDCAERAKELADAIAKNPGS
jgi:hypothetical protein